MIGWLVNNAPGAYVIGAVAVAVGLGLLWHLTHEWRRVRAGRRRDRLARQRRLALARQYAQARHPSRQHMAVRVLRPVVRASPPLPRPAPDRTGTLPGLTGARMLLPVVDRAEGIPGQRSNAAAEGGDGRG